MSLFETEMEGALWILKARLLLSLSSPQRQQLGKRGVRLDAKLVQAMPLRPN